jgi:glycerol transport system ATP-binding protein
MRLMAGLEQPSSGRVLLDGNDMTGVSVRKRRVAMVYQQFINYPTLTVYENIASPLRVARMPRAELERRVEQAVRLLRLETLLDRLPQQLSGGQQQRTAIARALVKRADLVLLDEPLANLDYKLREELREELPLVFAESGAILVYATTEPTEALLLGGTTATLWEGRVTQVGPTPAVYRRPENIDAARVFSDPPLNEFGVQKAGAAVELAGGRQLPALGPLSGLADGAYRLGFRAEDATLARGTLADGALANGAPNALRFPGQVSVTELAGSESFVHVEVGVGIWVCLIPGIHDAELGARVEVCVDPRRLLVFDASGALAAAPPLAETA